MKNFYENELRQMFDANTVLHGTEFTGDTMVARLKNNLVVKIQFSTHEMNEICKNAITVAIINPIVGVLDVQQIKFRDVIGRNGNHDEYYIVAANGSFRPEPCWENPISLEQKAAIADTVLGYVSVFDVEAK